MTDFNTPEAANADTGTQRLSVSTVMHDAEAMLATLSQWAESGWIRWLDVELARFLHENSPADEPASAALLLAAALCSHQNGHGHACLDLGSCLANPNQALLLPPDGNYNRPDIQPGELLANLTLPYWLTQLRNTHLVSDGDGLTPLVLIQHGRRPLLYLRRFWRYEQRIRAHITQRLAAPPALNDDKLREVLDLLFSTQPGQNRAAAPTPDWQKIACANSTRHRFAIITGGPGTGKTTTVVRLLAALVWTHEGARPLRIHLAAPTGKAAVRLSESIGGQIDSLPVDVTLPREVSTIHRLLGPVPQSRRFRHHGGNPLPADVVVIDEASMVDIELFAQLLEALPDTCRLILLGDKDQLASVEAGAVLGSLCERAAQGHYLPQTASWVAAVTGQNIPADLLDDHGQTVDQAITMLRHSYRSAHVPGITKLANAVNQQQAALESLFENHNELQLTRLSSLQDSLFRALVLSRDTGYGQFLAVVSEQQPDLSNESPDIWTDWALKALRAFGQFRLLAAVHASEFGTETLNRRVEQLLRTAGLQAIGVPAIGLQPTGPRTSSLRATGSEPTGLQDSSWYSGRPVMLTRNDYNLKLMNGDIGITLLVPGTDGQPRLRIAFPGNETNTVRWVSPARLQAYETAFAMTVHKSQGSEFPHTALVLPAYDSPVLTRELIYTAVTRASQTFTLLLPDVDILTRAVERRVMRSSGLQLN